MKKFLVFSSMCFAVSAHAATWTCAGACVSVETDGSTNGPASLYIVDQAPTAKEAFEKIVTTCQETTLGKRSMLSSGSVPLGISNFYWKSQHQPLQLANSCIREE